MDSDLMNMGELSSLIGARYISFSSNPCFSSVAINSRNVSEGCLFFALNGKSCDGHSFVGEAFNSGACGAMVEFSKLDGYALVNLAQKTGKELIIVENTLKGLQDSARVYLEKFNNLVKVGITGSSGKTTIKEIASSIISCEKNTVMNEGNYNSETGLPLSVFKVRPHHEVGVFELGMNRKGEIREIANVLKPNIALISNIGTAHIEHIGSKLNILNEKKCIFNFLNNGDTALIPKDDGYSNVLADGVNARVSFYGIDTFAELEQTRSLGLEGTEITWAGEKIRFALPGKHSLYDAIAAIAIAKEIHVTNDAIKKGLEKVRPLFGRLEILKGRTIVIRDCYNANPESAEKSIEFCNSLDRRGRMIFVIGDMLELGEISASAHAKLGELLSESRADRIFLFGRETAATARVLESKGREFFHTENIEELSFVLDSYVQTDDIVLLKGSRGCALERLSEMLTGGIQ
jgi:UDP-N-acetylmuramoyl-tripeptide--D-alanyl-D-alanine ligase